MEIPEHLSSAELKRQIEAMKKEVARKEKKLKWLERVSKNRKNTAVAQHLKKKYCDGLQKEEPVDSKMSECEKEKSKAADETAHNISEEHFKSNKYIHVHEQDMRMDKMSSNVIMSKEQFKSNEYIHEHDKDTCTNKTASNVEVSEEHFKNNEYIHSPDRDICMDKISSNVIVNIKDIDHKDCTKDQIKHNCESVPFDKMCTYKIVREQENIIQETEKDSTLKTSADIDTISKKFCTESSQSKHDFFEQKIHSTEASLPNVSNLCVNAPLRRSTRLVKCKQYSDFQINQTNTIGDSTDKIYCEIISNSLEPVSNSLSSNVIPPNEMQDNSDNCLKNLFLVLGEKAKNLSNCDFVLPDEEYASLKLEVLTEKPLIETQNICKQKTTPAVSERAEDNSQEIEELGRISKRIDNETGHKHFCDRQHCKTIVSDSSLRLQNDIESIFDANDLEKKITKPKCTISSMNSSPQSSMIKNSPCSSYICRILSPHSNDMENTLSRFENSEINIGTNNKTSSSHSAKNSVEMLELEQKQANNENNTAMKLIFSLKADSTECVKKINLFLIPQEEYILIQHVTKVSIWTRRNQIWLYNCTFTADIGEKVLDSCLLHQNSTLYFAVALSHIDGSGLNIYTFNPKLKCLEKFYSQTKPFQRTNLCKLEDKTFAAAYSKINISTIYVYNIQENIKDTCNGCISHLLASVNDYIESLLVVDNLPHALLCCGQEYIYIWNDLTNKLMCKIYMGKEISTNSCYRAYALKGLLFLIMIRHLELQQRTESCLIALNPATTKYKILRTYCSLKDNQICPRSVSAREYYVSILDDCKLTIYNLFTAQEIVHMKDCKAASVSTVNKSCIVMVGFDNGTTHCYQFV